jgi:hypothetical protein
MAAGLAAGRLAQIGALIEACLALLAKGGALNEASEAIGRALRELEEGMVGTAADLEEEAVQFERQAAIDEGRAYSAAARAGVADPWPPADGARELLKLAHDGFQEAASLVAAATGSPDEASLTQELARLKASLSKVSTLLGHGR